MTLGNPYKEKIKTLNDVKDLSFRGTDAIGILKEHMQYDPAHDESHIVRVVQNTLWFGQGGNVDVMIPAAILHDLVNVPKDSPNRKNASMLSAQKAIGELMKKCPLFSPSDHVNMYNIFHAIKAHSWSAGVEPLTLEAKALQDADRIDSLGAIGIARLFATGGVMGRTLFHPKDPLAENRDLDEKTYTLDHYFIKLRKLSGTMQTDLGRQYAEHLTRKMEAFVQDLKEEM